MKTLQQLKNNGFKVRVTHFRRAYMSNGEINDCPRSEIEKYGAIDDGRSIYSGSIMARGGKTKVEITKPDGTVLVGIAKCHPKDNYNKSEGILRAIKKAFS